MKTFLNFISFQLRKKSSMRVYLQMRNDFIVNKSKDIEKCCSVISQLKAKYIIPQSNGVLGNLLQEDVAKIATSIKNNGFYVFQKKLAKEKIGSIKSFMETAPVTFTSVKNNMQSIVSKSGYRSLVDLSTRFDIANTKHCNNNKAVLDLVADENFLHVSNEYLGSKPILDIVTLWWNRPIPGNLSSDEKAILKSASAQMYHHDLDRLKFLKFFVYLTDVDFETGPHVYVKGTHNISPSYITSDGRYSDDLIDTNAAEDVIKICGEKGTIIAVDTRGLHKGLEVVKDERLLFQIEFTNSLFGKPDYPTCLLNLLIKEEYKKSYKLFS